MVTFYVIKNGHNTDAQKIDAKHKEKKQNKTEGNWEKKEIQ